MRLFPKRRSRLKSLKVKQTRGEMPFSPRLSVRTRSFSTSYRSLRAYEEAFKQENTSLVINTDSEFFDYLKGVEAE